MDTMAYDTTFRSPRTTTCGRMAGLGHSILWVIALSAAGCAPTPPMKPVEPAPVAVAPEQPDASVPERVAAEADPARTPAEDLPPAIVGGPGADALALLLADRLGPGRPRTIDLSGLRNQSRATASEFAAMRRDFAEALDASRVDAEIAFIDDPAAPRSEELRGSAYLVTVDGFDLWELFLRLYVPGERSPRWQSGRPVRLLRAPAPGQPFVVAWPLE